MARAVQRPAARRDFIIHYVHIAENTRVEVAKRFRQAVESAYAQLARTPRLGAAAKLRRKKKHTGSRGSWSGFPESTLAPAFHSQDLRKALWLPRFLVRISGKHSGSRTARSGSP